MVATPATVAAGSTFELRFPQSTRPRSLRSCSSDPWTVHGSLPITWWPRNSVSSRRGHEADAEIMIAAHWASWDRVQISLLVPDTAPPGDYRLCTDLESKYACIPIEILPPSP